eukprot:11173382-Lingulodinium_polyedra.AAC.1
MQGGARVSSAGGGRAVSSSECAAERPASLEVAEFAEPPTQLQLPRLVVVPALAARVRKVLRRG